VGPSLCRHHSSGRCHQAIARPATGPAGRPPLCQQPPLAPPPPRRLLHFLTGNARLSRECGRLTASLVGQSRPRTGSGPRPRAAALRAASKPRATWWRPRRGPTTPTLRL
jgi:hypothetical protein